MNDPVGRLYARAYDQITDLYVEPVAPAMIAMAGLQRLGSLDDKLEIQRRDGGVMLRYDGVVVDRVAAPADDDAPAWGGLTAVFLQAAKSVSTSVASVPEEKLQQTVFDGLLAKLDRFSRYAPPDLAKEHRASRDGFGGIGVTLDYAGNDVKVTAVMPDSPASRAGMQVEDRISRIDGQATAGMARGDIVRRLRGPVDSRVELTLSRPGRPAPVSVAVHRAFIVAPSVQARFEDGIVLLRVTTFNHSTAQQVTDELALARKRFGSGLKGVVLDLRGNPGGLLDQSVAVADLFLKDGPIVSTRGRHPASQQIFRASNDRHALDVPLVVLINGGSASASEIVAAAVQDQGRAVVVGSASYGKGTVQNVLRLPNDAELTLTWAKLISPGGYVLHEHGVVPTICTSGLGDSDADVQRAVRRGTLAAAPNTAAARRRVDLDEGGWGELRHACPTQTGDHEIEVKVAKRLLAIPHLYAKALHPAGESIAATRPQ